MSAACPELEELELNPLPPTLRKHVDSCSSCKLVLDVFDLKGSAGDDECLRFEPLIAARAGGSLNSAGVNLLDRHLAGCSTCRALESLSPSQDALGDHASLPKVEHGEYEIGLEIGRGGMGRVLAARDLRIGRPVAIKELRGNSPALAVRFEREARVTARLQHPGIVPIYEIGRWAADGTPFYAMRMVDGRMLRVAIERASSLAQRLAMLPNVIAACEAVAFAHAQRVIHRDLTPSNILVGAYGETVVIDWGLAKDLSLGSSLADDADDPYRTTPEGSALTGVGTVVGTAAYMPPEQARADAVDERADVYALGAILYHLLAGKAPYPGGTGALDAVKAGPPPAIDKVAPRTPRDLVSIVSKAMARDQRDRYPSARELADELKRFQTGRLVEAHAYTRAELVKRFVARHRAPVIVLLAATLVLGVFAWMSVSRIIKSRAEARVTVRDLHVEKGREELLAGNAIRALAYLDHAYKQGARDPMAKFLLGNALANVASSENAFDCGGDARWVEFAPDGKSVAAACHDRGAILELDTGLAKLLKPANGFDWVKYAEPSYPWFVTSGDDGVARLWDAKTGALVREFPHGRSMITFSTLTDDASRLLTTGDDGYAKVWNVATGELVVSVHVSGNRVWGKIAGKGDLFFTMTMDGEGKGWDAKTGQLRGVVKHGTDVVVGAEISKEGKYAVTCGRDTFVKVWDLEHEAALYRTFVGHNDVVLKCIFSPDSRFVLTAGQDGVAKIWNLATGEMRTSVSHGAFVWSAAFAPDSRRFYTLGANGRIDVWDTLSGALLASWDTAHGKNAAFSPDGSRLAVVRGDGRVQVWDDPRIRIASYASETMTPLAASADGMRVVVEDDTPFHGVTVHDTRTGTPIATPQLAKPIAVSAQDRLAAVAVGGVAIIELATGRHVTTLNVGCSPSRLDLAADRLAVTCGDRVALWDVAAGRAIKSVADATWAQLSSDGRRAVLLSGNRSPRIWDIDSGVRRPLPLMGEVIPLGFARDGTRVAFTSKELARKPHIVSLVDANTGMLLRAEPDTSIAPGFDPSGAWLTTISAAGITVWSSLDGSLSRRFSTDHTSHQYLLNAAQASPDGQLVAAIGGAGTYALVLNARDGRELSRWPIVHDRPIVSKDGFTVPQATVSWTRAGDAVVTRSLELAVWNARYAPDQFTPARIASIMRKHVPWRVGASGELELVRDATLHGRVERNGQPLGNVKVKLEIRIAPGGSPALDFATMKTQFNDRETVTDADGAYAFDGLVPNEYKVTVEGKQEYVTVGDDTEHAIELTP